MGILEQAAGNLPAALGRYERAAQLEPENATVHYRLSGLYQKLGNQEKARAGVREVPAVETLAHSALHLQKLDQFRFLLLRGCGAKFTEACQVAIRFGDLTRSAKRQRKLIMRSGVARVG